MLAYEEHRNTNGLNANDTTSAAAITPQGGTARGSLDTNMRVGVGFKGGPVTVNAVYESLDLRSGGASNMDGLVRELKRDAFWIGAKLAAGNHEVRAALAQSMKATVTKNFVESDVDNSEARQISLGYGYNFSKRSQVYAVYSSVDNKSAAQYDFGLGKSKTGTAVGADPEGYSVGVRHLF